MVDVGMVAVMIAIDAGTGRAGPICAAKGTGSIDEV